MQQKIGVWGFGIGGKSVVSYLHNEGYSIEVMDKNPLSFDEFEFLNTRSITYLPEAQKDRFFQENSIIIPSQGIDLRPYNEYRRKWLPELDLFFKATQKPIIGVTGTIGKTSVVYLLEKVLRHYDKHYALGGNVGRGMLDLIACEKDTYGSLLELSSWQLEYTSSFAPELAIWTNLYPNHLDRHDTFEHYFQAKFQILKRQQATDKALVPWELRDLLIAQPELAHRALCFFSSLALPDEQLARIRPQDTLYMPDHTGILTICNLNHKKKLLSLNELPKISYASNWLLIAATCHMLNLSVEHLSSLTAIELPPHRLEYVATHNGIAFYNDSKATIPEATLAALKALSKKPILLLVGGLSKGIDRAPAFKLFSKYVTKVFCFGAEANSLLLACTQAGIKAEAFSTLVDAFYAVNSQARPDDQVLLSPGGSSFDLFKNHQERGDYFKQLVNALIKT